MAFLTEAVPLRGVAVAVAPGVRRVVADNPGPMTYHGTNTYLIETSDGVMVLDPGPDDPGHRAAVLTAAGRVVRILVSHSHSDHVAGLTAMREATGAAVFAFDAGLAPDHLLADGDGVAGWSALHTPGHAPDHICFARADGVVMSADHVMGWSTSMVGPPDGSMADYFESLRRMLARHDRVYLPGHGPAVPEPQAFMRLLLDHRLGREAAILDALGLGKATVADLVDRIYAGLAAHLKPAAERSVLAHLIKLKAEGRAGRSGGAWIIPDARSAPSASG